MIAVFSLMVAISLLLSVAFALVLGPPQRSRNRRQAWLEASLAWSSAALDLVLLLLLFDIDVNPWGIAAVLLAKDAVVGWRLWRLVTVRQKNGQNDVHNGQ